MTGCGLETTAMTVCVNAVYCHWHEVMSCHMMRAINAYYYSYYYYYYYYYYLLCL